MNNQITQKNTGFLGGGMQAVITREGKVISQATSGTDTNIIIQSDSIHVVTTAQKLTTLSKKLKETASNLHFNSSLVKEGIIVFVVSIEQYIESQKYVEAIDKLSQLKREIVQMSDTEKVEPLLDLLKDY